MLRGSGRKSGCTHWEKRLGSFLEQAAMLVLEGWSRERERAQGAQDNLAETTLQPVCNPKAVPVFLCQPSQFGKALAELLITPLGP